MDLSKGTHTFENYCRDREKGPVIFQTTGGTPPKDTRDSENCAAQYIGAPPRHILSKLLGT